MYKFVSLILVYLLCFSACGEAQVTRSINSETNSTAAKLIPFRLLKTYTRKANNFTQGFYYFAPNIILESSGLYQKSFIQYYDLLNGKASKFSILSKQIFAEGLTYKKPYIYLLTWKEHKCLVLDTNFKLHKTLPFFQEGWGITHDGERFIVSTGSDSLYFYDQDFRLQGSIGVFYPDTHQPLRNLNELEYVNGFIFANIWQEDRIVKINPKSGEIVGYLELGSLIDSYLDRGEQNIQDAVLNGIAWDKERELMYLTGKNWPVIFVIRLL